MEIVDKKNLERITFKNLREESSSIERSKVVINVELYLENIFSKGLLKNYVGIYGPLKGEVDIRRLRSNYPAALPRCEKNGELIFCAWDKKILTKDFQGILSPEPSNLLISSQISIIFVPCLSVDKDLTRLGYGGGYFDKLRRDKNWRKIPCIGVLTSNCISKNLLTKADWDIPLSGYITEEEIFI